MLSRFPVENEAINKTVAYYKEELKNSHLKEGEQFNLAGYSYGSVLQAQAPHFANYNGNFSSYYLDGVEYFNFDVKSFGGIQTINASGDKINQYLGQSVYGR